MQSVNECYKKVKKDCFKFINSQETSAEKFKNKDRMIKTFLIPTCFWITEKLNKKKTFILGLGGGQGSGKTTISSIITLILKNILAPHLLQKPLFALFEDLNHFNVLFFINLIFCSSTFVYAA